MKSYTFPHLFQEELYYFNNPVVVVVPQPWENYGVAEQTLLQKILTSVKIDMDTILIKVQPLVELETLKIFSPSHVLIFGSGMEEEIPFYESTQAQGFTVIRADDLSAFDDQKKKNLWIALRQMFGL